MKFRCAFVVWKISFVAWGLVFGLAPRLQAQGTIAPDPKYAAISKAIESLVQREIETKELPAVSIALVDGKEIVWAKGFGFADPRKKTPATAETVYRVGSVSKLFTDVGIMQLVEKGVLDLDAPVTRYIPNFKPVNPSNKPITLRQLMSHRWSSRTPLGL